MMRRYGPLVGLLLPSALFPAVLTGCGNSGGGAVPRDSTTRRGQGVIMTAQPTSAAMNAAGQPVTTTDAAGNQIVNLTPAPPTGQLPDFPDAFVPPAFSGVQGALRFTYDGDVAGQSNTSPTANSTPVTNFTAFQTNPCGEPQLISLQSLLTSQAVPGDVTGGQRLSDGTTLLGDGSVLLTGGAPNPALIAGRYNIDIDLMLTGLPAGAQDPAAPATIPDQAHPTGGTPLPLVAGYDADAPDVEATEGSYSAHVADVNAIESAQALGGRRFRFNTIRNGRLQLWLMSRVPVQTTITASGVSTGQRQVLAAFYARSDGHFLGTTNAAGQLPAAATGNDVRVELPGPMPANPSIQLPGPIRMIGLPPFRGNTDGTAHVRFFVIGDRITDAAITGGFEVAIVPRSLSDTRTRVVLLRTVPADETFSPLTQLTFLAGAQEFGAVLSLEPPGETGLDLALRNPIDVITFQPTRTFTGQEDSSGTCGTGNGQVTETPIAGSRSRRRGKNG